MRPWRWAVLALPACRLGFEGEPDPSARTATDWALVAEARLAAGQIEASRELLAEGFARHPGAPRLRWTQASLCALDGDARAAVMALEGILVGPRPPDLSLAEVQGFLGDLQFDAGEYEDSVAPLLASSGSVESARRQALAKVAAALPARARAVFPAGPVDLELLAGPLPQVAVEIAGRQVALVLDTGSSWTALATSTAQALGLPAPIAQGFARDGRGLPFEVGFTVAPSVALGGVVLGPRPVAVVEDARMLLRDPLEGGGARFDGLLGMDLLRQMRIECDPTNKRVRILPRTRTSAGTRCFFDAGRLVCAVEVEGQSLWFLLDTGSSRSSLTTLGLERIPQGPLRADTGVHRIRSPGGTDVAVRELTVRSLVIDGLRVRDLTLPVLVRDSSGRLPLHGVLGADVLLRGQLVLDGSVVELRG